MLKDKLKELGSLLIKFKGSEATEEAVVEKVDEVKTKLEEEVKESFFPTTLEDGTDIEISGENVEIGATVSLIVDGEAQPMPDGTHTILDGTQIVTEAGVIIEVVPADEEAPAEEAVEEEAAAEDAFNAESFKADILAEVKELIKGLVSSEDFSKSKEDFAAIQSGALEAIEELALAPSDKPTERKKTLLSKISTKVDSDNSVLSKIRTLKNN